MLIAYGRENWTALNELDKMESWEAISLLLGTYCGDASFLYFRNWVIWQGRDIKDLFVKDPDSLLKLAHQNQLPISEPFVECLTALNAYNQGSTASRLVSFQASNVGYSRLSLVRALWVVNCQSILALS